MVIQTKVEINGVEFSDYQNARVSKTINSFNGVSNYKIRYDSPYGRHNDDFTVGDTIEIFSDENVIMPTVSPIAHYKMNDDEADTVVVDSAGSNNGTCSVNTDTINTTGKINGTLDSITDAKHETGDSFTMTPIVLDPSVGATVCFWHYTRSLASGWEAPNEYRDGKDAFFGLSTDNHDSCINWYHTNGEITIQDEAGTEVRTGHRLLLNTWQHVTIVYKASETLVYLNGVLTDTLGALTQTTFDTVYRGYAGVYHDGYMDDVRIYNSELSANDISAIYNQGNGNEDETQENQTLLKGTIEKVKFTGRGTSQVVDISGKDFTSRLNDSTVLPVVYTDSEISTIVTNIIDNNVPNVTTNNVEVTETTLQRMVFNHSSVFDALTQLAELSGYYFYVDEDSDLHFKKNENVDSGISLDNTNITKMLSNTTREGMANSIWVYGDRQLAGFRETNLLDGSTWGGEPGSIFTLLSKPHNTLIEYLGNPLVGGIYQMAVSPTSGPDYLVNFEDKQLIFQSGTEIGYSSIPISGGSIYSTYDREIPIVKFGENENSISQFGKKVKVINDKTIKDPTTALDILKSELEKADPFNGLEVSIDGWFDITPGNTLKVTLDDFNIDKSIGIIDVDYIFDKNSIQSEKVIKVRLDTKILDLTDQITDLHRRLGLIEAQDRQDSDVITRLMQSTGSLSVIGSSWYIKTREVTGSTMIWDNPRYNTWDTDKWGNESGSPFTPYTIITSGGYYS